MLPQSTLPKPSESSGSGKSNISPDIEWSCEALDDIHSELKELAEKRERLIERRHVPAATLYELVGKDMIARGQKSRTMGNFRIEAGIEALVMCACHGALLSSCDTVGPVQLIPCGHRPYVRVKRIKP
jgi:hypothetical protein